jgi:peptide/nickel transport system permease protein
VSAFLKLLARNRLALGGLIVMGIVVLLAIVTPLLPLADPDVTTRPTGSSRRFPKARLLGTDHLGRDLLSRLL